MQDNFKKFKKRIWRDILIKSSVIGLGSALICIGTILLVCKLSKTDLLFSVIGIVGLLAGGVAFLCFGTNDVAIAKKLDKTFGFGQKVQTMVEFRDKTDDMAVLQRNDVQKKLGEVSEKDLPFTRIWVYVAVAVTAIALFVTAVALPYGKHDGNEDKVSPPKEVTDWEWQALDELIEEVKSSSADENIMKPKTLEALYSLRSLLQNGVTVESFSTFLEETVTAINNAWLEANAQPWLKQNELQLNDELRIYVIKKLYEIFDVELPAEKVDNEKGDNNEEPGQNGGSGGTGSILVGADEGFFHPELGYIKYSDVINFYYDELNKAFTEGVLEEEWYDYLNAYFEYLYGIKATE